MLSQNFSPVRETANYTLVFFIREPLDEDYQSTIPNEEVSWKQIETVSLTGEKFD